MSGPHLHQGAGHGAAPAHGHDDHRGHSHGAHGDGAHGHSHAHGPLDAHDHGGSTNRRRLFLAAFITCAFMVAEAVGGVLTGSLALLADAGHMLTDSVALVLAYVAYRMSERPGTSRMTYGFDRLKVVVAYTNGLTVLLIAVWIVGEAAARFVSPAPVLGGPMMVIAVLGLAANVAVFFVLHGGDRESLNLKGAILHVIGDMLGSAAAILAAGIIIATGWTPADPILSVLVALILLRSAWRLVREAGLILLEAAPPTIDRNAVASDLVGHAEGVADVHHMHVWTLDGKRMLATLHARLKPDADAERSIAAVKERLGEAHGIHHATVEVETGPECPEHGRSGRERGTRYGTA